MSLALPREDPYLQCFPSFCMAESGDDLEWVMSFCAIVYSRDKLHRHKFKEPLVLKQDKNSISLKNGDAGKVVGTLTFYTPHNTCFVRDIEAAADNILTNFRQSLLLCEYLIDVTQKGTINGTSAGPDRRFRVESSVVSAWRQEGQTRTIDEQDSNQIKSYFTMMFSDKHLKKIAERIERRSEFPLRTADFIFNWIEFNKVYNPGNHRNSEQKKISQFVQNLPQHTINLLCRRNLGCITKYKAQDKNALKLIASQKSREAEAVCSSLLSIYQRRNYVFHEGQFQDNDLDIINNFVFDVVNSEILGRLNDPNLAQFYGG